jgi:hypothetical protein
VSCESCGDYELSGLTGEVKLDGIIEVLKIRICAGNIRKWKKPKKKHGDVYLINRD